LGFSADAWSTTLQRTDSDSEANSVFGVLQALAMCELPADKELPATGDLCLRTGAWQTDDDDRQVFDIKRGMLFPACPFCGGDVGWIYLNE
jgi:hypothetical protein